jgi:3-deoxy-D-manno-octulosonate 8-phosphate phosphatase (KDO 8-P phosphatase)
VITAEAAARVKLICLDVDGVLTDAGYYLGDIGGQKTELLRYDIQDGVGILLAQMAGLRVAIITGRESESVRLRAQQLKITDLVQDRQARKLPALRRMIDAMGVDAADVAFLGDDLPDLGVLRVVGMPVAVGNAVAEVKRVATVHLERTGGHGAIREFIEMLLKARGTWDATVERYVHERSTAELS